MKLNKSPGIDGVSVEFYRTFWTNLKEIVVKVFNTCYQKEEMNTLQKIEESLYYIKKETHFFWTTIDQLLYSKLTQTVWHTL